MSLTTAHLAAVARDCIDAGPIEGATQTDADYADWVDRLLASHPAPDQPTQLFAYGSLIWKPEVPSTAHRLGRIHGWHRCFCMRLSRFRGTPDFPGLMMALDRGGSCTGVMYQLPAQDLPGQLDMLFRREFTSKPNTNIPRWVKVQTDAGAFPALAFVMNRASPLYVKGLPPKAVADVLARACGHMGSGAEYLYHTVKGLQEHGLHDAHLWHLQRLVADRIDQQA